MVERLLGIPPDITGDYYYITTPQEGESLPVKCQDIADSKKIGGMVRIEHKRTLLNPVVRFINGERIHCVSTKNSEVSPAAKKIF